MAFLMAHIVLALALCSARHFGSLNAFLTASLRFFFDSGWKKKIVCDECGWLQSEAFASNGGGTAAATAGTAAGPAATAAAAAQ